MVGPRRDPAAAQPAAGRRLPHRLKHGVHGKTEVRYLALTVGFTSVSTSRGCVSTTELRHEAGD